MHNEMPIKFGAPQVCRICGGWNPPGMSCRWCGEKEPSKKIVKKEKNA